MRCHYLLQNLVRFLKSGSQIKNAQEALAYIDQQLYGEPPVQEELSAPVPVLPAPEVQPQTPLCTPPPTQDHSAYMPPTGQPQTPASVQTPMPARSEVQMPEATSSIYTPPQAQSPAVPIRKKNNGTVVGIVATAVVLAVLAVSYFTWYVPYAKDRDALRTYVVATNVFLRSSQVAGVEYNVVNKLPYGSELITYSISDEWAEVKANGTTGYVASAYLLNQTDFNLLHGVWGNMDARDCIISSKCRLAILDYYKNHALSSGSTGWQIYTKQKDQKPNTVFYPRLYNKSSKFTDFIFIVKNNATGERTLACYSFEDETERPIFRFDTAAPTDGYIRSVQGSYTGTRIAFDTGAEVNVNF